MSLNRNIIKTWLGYAGLTVAFAFLASGAVISAFIDVYDRLGMNILWLMLPLIFMFVVAMAVDVKYAIPGLLLRQRYVAYCIVIVGISYVASLGGFFMECRLRDALGLPQRIKDFGSPWICVDALSNSILMMLVLLGIGARRLYVWWMAEATREKRMADSLKEYMNDVRQRLNPEFICGSLERISESLMRGASDVMEQIRSLSDYLRAQLYEMPKPSIPAGFGNTQADYSSLTNFLVGRKYRWLRHAAFQLLLLVISFGTIFDSPDSPDFENNFGGFIAMYFFLNLLAYVNVLWLFRRFKRHRHLKKYLTEVGCLLLAVIIPLIAIQIVTYDLNPYDKHLPVAIQVTMTLGTLLTLFFFIGGTSAIMMDRDRVAGKRRIMLLHAETVRQEYAFLKKQINPHFLFNVLNNIGILSFDEPEEAALMLSELRKLVEYQFAETDSNTTTLRSETEFLRSYLALEGTRLEPFSFEISSEGCLDDVEVPTLLFIPFVENAVKYSSVVDGKREVAVRFSAAHAGLEFRCANTFRPRNMASGAVGGLGISNTLRRLNLLYGTAYSYSRRIISNRYVATLYIPVSRKP